MKRQEAQDAFAALAHPLRFEALLLITQAGANGISAGDIGRALKLPLTTLSFHLGRLYGADLVERRSEGKRVVYTANQLRLRQTAMFLDSWGQAGGQAPR